MNFRKMWVIFRYIQADRYDSIFAVVFYYINYGFKDMHAGG
jgi:hypothetical protein